METEEDAEGSLNPYHPFQNRQEFESLVPGKILELDKLWRRDSTLGGEILRAHLFVEHHLDIYLKIVRSDLKSRVRRKMKFSQKIGAVGKTEACGVDLSRGLKRINLIRNRFAHSLRAEILPEDIGDLLLVEEFAHFRSAALRFTSSNGEESWPDDPKHVVGSFARFASLHLAGIEDETARRVSAWFRMLGNASRIPAEGGQ